MKMNWKLSYSQVKQLQLQHLVHWNKQTLTGCVWYLVEKEIY